MKIKVFPLGIYMTNSYLVWNEKGEATLFDCGSPKFDKLIKFINENSLKLINIVLTHGHADHIGGINEMKRLYPDTKIYIGEEDKPFLTDSSLSLSQHILGCDFKYTGSITTLKEGDSIFGFDVIDTPGHTIGSKCFYNKDSKLMISGDTMFKRSYGRYDLATSSYSQLKDSLKKLCDRYPDDILVYSGHSDFTVLGEEKKFLKSIGMI